MVGRIVCVVAIAVFAASGCNSTPGAEAPSAKAPAAGAYAPVVSLNEIMVYVVDPHSNEIWDAALKPPTTEEGWRELQHAAVVLAAAGNLTALSGNGPKDQEWVAKPDWNKYSQAVAEAGVAAVQAVRARNVEAISKAGDRLNLTCINCHREYKLDVPKIWTERQFPPEAGR